MSSQDKTAQKSFFADLKIGIKLGIGFGVLVLLIFFNALVSYVSSRQATDRISTTDELRVPAALSASQAQANLLRMLSDVRGYLALGDQQYRDSYQRSAEAFEADLANLEEKAPELDPADQQRLKDLRVTYEQWKPLPEQLFELRDDQLDREPAYRTLATNGVEHAGNVIIALNQMIIQQSRQDATRQNMEILSDMSNFQGNFLAMLSALRGYVTTRNQVYRYEYEANRLANDEAWSRLLQSESYLTVNQQELLETIKTERQAFLDLENEIFTNLESDRWREDLYRFTTEAVPLATRMDVALNDLVGSQQSTLAAELGFGRDALDRSNRVIVISGIVAFLFGAAMAYASRRAIAQPIGRLTNVAEQIREGALDTQAQVESRDEIGVLASTFNNMTGKLRDTLFQVRKEKKRADDLLEVVIPIGVDLSTEKDFNRLLEKMVMEAKSFCRADTGILYMINPKDELEFVIARSDSLSLALGGTTGNKLDYAALPLKTGAGEPNQGNMAARVALSGETVNLTEFTASGRDLWGDDPRNQIWRDYSATSLLALPLKNSTEQVLGVLQLINAQDADTRRVIPFDPNLQQMMESFSSLAVAALEAFAREQKLKQEIQQLKIEIDQAKRQKQVSEIVDSDFFKDLTSRAKEMRSRQSGAKGG